MQVSVPFSPEQASTFSGQVDTLYGFLWAMTIFFGVVISLLILYFAVKYRRRSHDEIPRPVEGSMRLEVAWTVTPFLVTMGLFVWASGIYYNIYRAPREALEIYVVAKQWMWKMQHVDGKREINELHVPVGRKVKLTMTTEDVIHSFYVPAFRIKMDVVPGKYSTLWFEATKPGRYHLFCAEYCGTNHSTMRGWVQVMEPVEFQQWLSQAGTGPSMAEQGERLFVQYHCAGCHRGSQIVHAPQLEGVYGRPVPIQQGRDVQFTLADERYIRDSILRPKQEVVAGYEPVMPSFEGQISEQDLLRIIAYIKSIGAKEATR